MVRVMSRSALRVNASWYRGLNAESGGGDNKIKAYTSKAK
jgi:hypothetical protein